MWEWNHKKILLIPAVCSLMLLKGCCYGQAVNSTNLINILQTGSLELKPCLIEVQPYALSELNPQAF